MLAPVMLLRLRIGRDGLLFGEQAEIKLRLSVYNPIPNRAHRLCLEASDPV